MSQDPRRKLVLLGVLPEDKPLKPPELWNYVHADLAPVELPWTKPRQVSWDRDQSEGVHQAYSAIYHRLTRTFT